jgi:hypothetical protein
MVLHMKRSKATCRCCTNTITKIMNNNSYSRVRFVSRHRSKTIYICQTLRDNLIKRVKPLNFIPLILDWVRLRFAGHVKNCM